MAKFARVTRFEDRPESVDAIVKQYRDTLAPAARKLAGCKGTYLMVDRKTGRGFSMTLWESEAAMIAGENVAAQLRSQATEAQREGGITLWSVDRYEVAVE